MQSQEVTRRERVRAVLLTPTDQLLLIRRVWPGATPYWVFPGGHVEPSDADLRAALIREVREETGGEPRIIGLLYSLDDQHSRQHFYLARIRSWSEDGRTGPEFDNSDHSEYRDHGEYHLEEVPLTAQALAAIRLVPEEIATFLRDALAAGTDLVSLAGSLGGS